VSFSLYIHIPWCESKCPYCDFNSYAAQVWPESDYVAALCAELARRVEDPPWRGARVETIFFGGGTPSLFKAESIAALLETIDRTCGIEPGAEITLEANPGTVDLAKLCGFRAAGVNRISFGAQSFDDAILKFLGRIHTADQTRTAATLAHRAGFERLNLDLIFAVPGQTLAGVRRDIESAAALGPDHISAYNLTFEEGTPFFGEMKRGRIVPQADEEQAQMYAAVRSELPARGYKMYEISNYAQAGREARHNLVYWRGRSYLGLGAGAHSFAAGPLAPPRKPSSLRVDPSASLRSPQDDIQTNAPPVILSRGLRPEAKNLPGAIYSIRALHEALPEGGAYGRRWWNERTPARYVAMATHGGIAEAGAELIDFQIAAGEFVFLNLRLRDGFALREFKLRFGCEFEQVFGARAARLFEARLLLQEHGRILLSDRGLELADSVFAEFV
jgi:oxygen-independent coproporphyrinogen-3 oxidase